MRLRSVFYISILLFSLFFLITGTAFGNDFKIESGIDAGYRVDNLRWNIAGNIYGSSPNILSELSWKNLKIFQIGAHTQINLDENVFLLGSFDYGIITSGKNQDSDYNGDNRTLEFSRSNNSSNGDNVGDISMAIGIHTMAEGSFQISPLFGYAYSWQNIRMTNGYKTIDTGNNYIGPFSGLNSTYKTTWQGPWVGVNLESEISSELAILGSFEYHIVDYSGEGNWNLRDDLDHPVSFKHSANGDGYTYSIGVDFSPMEQTHLILKYCYSSWSADDGTDTTYFNNGSYGVTRFNEAVWDSEVFTFSFVQRF